MILTIVSLSDSYGMKYVVYKDYITLYSTRFVLVHNKSACPQQFQQDSN